MTLTTKHSPPSRLLGLLLWLAAGCNVPGAGSGEAGPVTTFGEHRPRAVTVATLRLGEDCAANGGSACLSALCVHHKPGNEQGYTCSQACDSDDGCPESWMCRSIYPGPGNSFCFPPRDWKPQPTSAQRARQP